jgi:hypothetical protein
LYKRNAIGSYQKMSFSMGKVASAGMKLKTDVGRLRKTKLSKKARNRVKKISEDIVEGGPQDQHLAQVPRQEAQWILVPAETTLCESISYMLAHFK